MSFFSPPRPARKSLFGGSSPGLPHAGLLPSTAPAVGAAPPTSIPSPYTATQVSRHTDPNAPVPVQTSAGGPVDDFVATDTVTAGASGTNVTRTYPLPQRGDVTGIVVALTDTMSGTVTSTDIAKTLPAIYITKGQGGSQVCKFAGTDIYNLYADFSLHNTQLTTVNVTNTSATSSTFVIPGLRLPASMAPWYIELDFAAYSVFGTQVTGGTYTYSLTVQYGQAQGLVSHIVTTAITPVDSGFINISPVMPVQEANIHEVIFSGLSSSSTDITYFQIEGASGPQENRLLSTTIIARDAQVIQGTLPTTVLWLRERSAIAFNRSRGFWLQYGSSPASTINVLLYWVASQ